MPLPICLEIAEIPDALPLTLPGGISIEHANLAEMAQPALTPLVPVFDIIDTVVAVLNCLKSLPDSLGPPPDPTVITACLPDLTDKVNKLVKLIPQLSLPVTIVGLIDAVIESLRRARTALLHLQQQSEQLVNTMDRAVELEDAGLMAIAQCTQTNITQEAANVGKSMASLGKLIGIINMFMGMIGGPEVPELSNLARRPLDEVVEPLDAIIESLKTVRDAVPVP